MVAHLFLIAREGLHAEFEIARHHPAQAVAVIADELAQEADGQQAVALAFLLDDDLGQYGSRNVVAGLGVIDHEIDAFLDHLGEVIEGNVAAGGGVIEPSIGVFLDGDGFVPGGRLFGHDATI
ncbi:MAG: hypothetical protein IIA00_10350 [Proteobacteria bacterium]|nr:hypothetical protein [Pseudomonadota bacterium]